MGAVNYKTTFDGGFGGGGMMGGGGSSSANNASYGGRNSPVNNGSYTGGAVKSYTPSSTTVSSADGVGVGASKQYGSSTVNNLNLYDYLKNLTNASSGLSYTPYTDEQKAQMPDSERSMVEQHEAMQKVAEDQNKKKDDVKEQTKNVADGINYQQGETLPSVLTKNTKALTEAVNTLTNVFTDQFTLLNNYMMGGLIYQQQFLDIKTQESGLKIESMEYHKSSQPIYDLDGNKLGDAVPRDLKVQKDAVVGIDNTDKINFNLDEDGDLDDIIDGIDLPSIFGYSGDTEPIKEFYTRLGGQGL